MKQLLLMCAFAMHISNTATPIDCSQQANICYEETMQHYYTGKQILVTGGCGFIGSHIVERLVKYGARVTVLDDLSTGFLHNIAPWSNKVVFIHGSITNVQTCKQAAQGHSHVFHLAACTSVAQSMQDPRTCHEINVQGTFNMLEASVQAGVSRFVFSSSAAVYGLPETVCCETIACKPISPYGSSKLIGEELCSQFYYAHNLQTVSLRYFNVFGPRQNPDGQYAAVVARFTAAMKAHEPITIYGDGLQTRDFIAVNEVVNANLLMGMAPENTLQNRVYNVASGKSITLLELIEELKKRYPDYHQTPIFLPARKGDIRESIADCSRLEGLVRALGYVSWPDELCFL